MPKYFARSNTNNFYVVVACLPKILCGIYDVKIPVPRATHFNGT